MAKELSRKVIPVTEMDCPSCALIVEKELKKLEGVEDARVNFIMRKVIITYDPKKVGVPDFEKKLEKLGYKVAYKEYESIFDKISKVFLGRKTEEAHVFRRVEDRDFDDLVLKSNRPVVVIFTSLGCPSCRVLKPRLKEATKGFEDHFYVYEMDITTSKKWEDFNVMSVPTLLYFRDGREMGRQVAFPEKADIERKITEILQM